MPRRICRRTAVAVATASPSIAPPRGQRRRIPIRPPRFAALALLVVLLGCAPLDRLREGDQMPSNQPRPSAPALAPAAPSLTPAPTPLGADAPPVPAPPTEAVAPIPPPAGVGLAPVAGVEVLLLESFPVQVQVVVTGDLPDPCTTIGPIAQARNGNAVTVTLPTVRDPDAFCAQVLVPFTETVPLAGEFPAGDYTVSVNGVERAFRV